MCLVSCVYLIVFNQSDNCFLWARLKSWSATTICENELQNPHLILIQTRTFHKTKIEKLYMLKSTFNRTHSKLFKKCWL